MPKKSAVAFLARLASVLLVAGVLVGLCNHYYVRGYYYSDVYSEIQKMKEVPDQIVMANFGTSHGLASFRYPEDGVVRFNFALSGEDIYHDYATLRQFADHLSPGCIVAIPVSYFSFCMSTQEPSQKRYYLYLDKSFLRGFTYETLLNAKFIPVLRSGEFIIKDLIKDQEKDVGAAMMEGDVDASDPGPRAETPSAASSFDAAMDAALLAHAKGRAESWRAGYMNAGRIFISENTRILVEMVRFCQTNGFRPVLVSTPIYTALNAQFTQEELQTCYFGPMAAVQAETGAPYLDLSHDSVLSTDPSFYGNSDHLTETGAAAFYERYTAFLRSNNILE